MISILKIIGFFLLQPTPKIILWQTRLWQFIILLVVLILLSFFVDIGLAEFISTTTDKQSLWYITWRFISKLGNGANILKLSFAVILIGFLSKVIFKKGLAGTIIVPLYVLGHYLFSGIIVQIFKFIFGRPRPYYSIETNISDWDLFYYDSHFQSFPSGHGNTSMAVLLVLLFTIKNIYLRALFITLALMISLSRIFLLKHYPSDIFAGWLLASFTMLYYMRIIKIKSNRISS